jgi:hypothetical protein
MIYKTLHIKQKINFSVLVLRGRKMNMSELHQRIIAFHCQPHVIKKMGAKLNIIQYIIFCVI